MGTFKTQKMAQMRATSRSAAFQVFKRWFKAELRFMPRALFLLFTERLTC
jgi:hypothetical protein